MKGLIQPTLALLGLACALVGAGCTTTEVASVTVSSGLGPDSTARAACPDCLKGACSAHGAAGCAGGNCQQGFNGCCDLYDCCYPQRYWYTSRMAVNAAFAPQVQNGHVLDQTVWAHHFEPGTDRLTYGGLQHLAYLARRRPQPDCTVYLQTANDLPYDPACPDHYAGARQELDQRRAAAVQKFLVANTAGRPMEFNILIHDPSDPSVAAIPVGLAVTQMYARWRGGLTTGAGGAGAAGGGGAVPGVR
jgi:hypothetical protein